MSYFEDNDDIQGQKESSVFLHKVVKPEDIDDPIPVGGCVSSPSPPTPLRDLISGLPPVEILAWTQTERLMKIYDLPTFSSTLEFLTMLATEYRTPPQRPSLPFSSPKPKKLLLSCRIAPPTSSLRRVMSSSTRTTQKYRSSPSRPRFTPRLYPRQFPVVAPGKLHQVPRRWAKHRL